MATKSGGYDEDVLDHVANLMAWSRLSHGHWDFGRSNYLPSVRPSRIEKPRGSLVSPRGLQRRRAHSSSRLQNERRRWASTNTGMSPINASTVHEPQDITSSRPVSWHPASLQATGIISADEAFRVQHISWNEVGPHSLPGGEQFTIYQQDQVFDGYPSLSGYLPAEGISQYHSSPAYPPLQHQGYPSHVRASGTNHGPTASPFTHTTIYYSPESNQIPEQALFEQQRFSTGVSDLLFVPNPPELMEDSASKRPQTPTPGSDTDEEGDVLIGLGLYDPPVTPPHPSGISALSQGRGLKLEETWIPPVESDDDVDAYGEDDDEIIKSDVAAVSGLPHVAQNGALQVLAQTQTPLQQTELVSQHTSNYLGQFQMQPEDQAYIIGDRQLDESRWWPDPFSYPPANWRPQ